MSDDNPTAINTPIEEKATVLAKEEKHWLAVALDVFVGIGAVSQVVIGIILICQLSAYNTSNDLTRQSLKLTEQTFKTSHIPWISAGEMTVGEPDGPSLTATIGFKNSSDTPAFHVNYVVNYSDDRVDSTNQPLVTITSSGSATWMPNSEYSLFATFRAIDPQKFKEALDDGDIVISTVITYDDIFGGRFRLTETWNKQHGLFTNPDSKMEYPDYSKQ